MVLRLSDSYSNNLNLSNGFECFADLVLAKLGCELRAKSDKACRSYAGFEFQKGVVICALEEMAISEKSDRDYYTKKQKRIQIMLQPLKWVRDRIIS